MITTRLDRIVVRIILVVLIVAGVIFGWSAYGRHLRHNLIQAAQAGDTATVRALLDRGVDPNADEPTPSTPSPGLQSDTRTSALQWAMTNHHYETAKVLIQKGAKASS